MKLKQELEDIKNKDLSKASSEELLKYKQELQKKSMSCEKINKVKLKKFIYNIIGYICGLGIGFCLGRILMTYIYTSTFSSLSRNLIYAFLFVIPIIVVLILDEQTKKNVQAFTETCNNKIAEIDRQIAINDFKKELEASKATQENN